MGSAGWGPCSGSVVTVRRCCCCCCGNASRWWRVSGVMTQGRAAELLECRAPPAPGRDRAAGLRRSWMHCLQAAVDGRMADINAIRANQVMG